MKKKIASIIRSDSDCIRIGLYLDGKNILDEEGNVLHILLKKEDLVADIEAIWGAPCWGLEWEEEDIINLTPHSVRLLSAEGKLIAQFVPSGAVARCAQKTVPAGNIEVEGISIPLTSSSFGQVEGLPEYKEGTRYIVSRLVLSACPERTDLLVPNELVRDEAGKIIGCRSLATR